MNQASVLKEFEKVGALLNGHFILSSGLHSPMFLQKALVFMHPKSTAKLCKALAKKVAEEIDLSKIDAIVSPAASFRAMRPPASLVCLPCMSNAKMASSWCAVVFR